MEKNNIEEIRKKAERFESQYNKLKQEFKDYIETGRRNEETKRQELKTDSAKKILIIADSLDRISTVYDNISCDIVKNYSENLKKNIDVIYSQLLSVSGLTQIDPARGDMFDDKMHTAIGLEYGTAYPKNSIFRVIRKGYRIENNVVRPAEVIVSKRPVEAIKIIKPGLWDRILRWISPAGARFEEINQRIDEFGRLQRENIEKLTQDIASLKNILSQTEARDQKVSELERIQKEEIERLRLDIAAQKNMMVELDAKNQKIYEFESIQKEKIEKLAQDTSSLRNIIMDVEEKIALKERTSLQGGDVSENAERGNEASKINSY